MFFLTIWFLICFFKLGLSQPHCPNSNWKLANFGGKNFCYAEIKIEAADQKHNILSICQHRTHKRSFLASIHSKDENNWLMTHFPGAMIGLHIPPDQEWHPTAFRWSDGTPKDFVQWDRSDPKQPDNQKPTERFVRLRKKTESKGWHDYQASEMTTALCKMHALNSKTTTAVKHKKVADSNFNSKDILGKIGNIWGISKRRTTEEPTKKPVITVTSKRPEIRQPVTPKTVKMTKRIIVTPKSTPKSTSKHTVHVSQPPKTTIKKTTITTTSKLPVTKTSKMPASKTTLPVTEKPKTTTITSSTTKDVKTTTKAQISSTMASTTTTRPSTTTKPMPTTTTTPDDGGIVILPGAKP